MKSRKFLSFLVLLSILLIAPNAYALVYQFIPTPNDLGDLDHEKYITWGIKLTLGPKEVVTGAGFMIDNINNWRVEPDILYVHLLDSPALGKKEFNDGEGGGDNFANWATPHILLTTYTDLKDSPGPSEDFFIVSIPPN